MISRSETEGGATPKFSGKPNYQKIMTQKMLGFIKDLADVLEKHSGGLSYTTDDDGIYVSIGEGWKGAVCIGWPQDGNVSRLRKIIEANAPAMAPTASPQMAVVHQPLVRPPRVREDVFGWFDAPEQATPAHDPGTNGLCPQCCWPVGEHSIDNPVKTISLAIEDRKYRGRSYFFRAHKSCWERATPHDRMMVESSLIDEEMNS